MKYDVPFVSNDADDLHCLQAAYLMIVKYFKPDFAMDWDVWSELTGFEKEKGTWQTAAMLWLCENGFEVKHITLFDFSKFISLGGDYLIELSGNEVGQWQIEHSNISLEQKRMNELLKSGVIIEQRVPTADDIKQALSGGYLVRCLINANRLNGKKGYFGHAIVVSGYDESGLIIQDPGLPPQQNRKVSFAEFESAWADPTEKSKELDLIKLL